MHLLADGSHLLGCLHVALGHLGDVDESLDAVAQLDEGPERDELGHRAFYDRSLGILLDELLPRVFGGLLQAERYALAVAIDVQDHDLDLVTDLHDLGGMVHMTPGKFGDVDEPVDAAQVHERAEVHDARHRALEYLALLQRVENGGPLFLAALLQDDATGQHHVVAVAVHLDDAGFEFLAQEGGEVLDPPEVHE